MDKSESPGPQDHPTVESERIRHVAWGHEPYEITTLNSQYKGYLCSCGIMLTSDRFEVKRK